MRAFGLMTCVGLAACSGGSGKEQAGVDVNAAAHRAERDIAYYAALGSGKTIIAPTPADTPSAPIMSAADPGSATAAAAVVSDYARLIGARRYREAWGLWRDAGQGSGMTEPAFAASFARYTSFAATVGTPFDADAGAGQRYITVPVHATAWLATGGRVDLDGPIVLHRVADRIDTPDPADHRWHIDRSGLMPHAATGTRSAS